MNKIEKNDTTKSKSALILSMVIFGTIGIVRKTIPLSSAAVACARGIIGTLFLLVFMKITGKKMSREKIRSYFPILVISGVMLGLNWILLFEAYRYTTVAIATLCYYMAPVFLILVSPILFKENISLLKGISVAVALGGMVLVSGVLESGFSEGSSFTGVLFGLGAAVLYAAIIAMNKKYADISPYDRTVVQLAVSALVLIPYVLLTEDFSGVMLTGGAIGLLLIAGIVHTGIAYTLYYGSMGQLKAQTIALFSYIDPIVAIILSAVLLHEPLSIEAVIGAVMILGATLFNELSERK